MIILSILIFGFTFIYLFQILRFYAGLSKLKTGFNTNLHSISIIIPARNEAQNISICLDSLIKQKYPLEKIEIIVINDHSTDQTEAIIRQYEKQYSHVKLINLKKDISILSHKKYAISEGIKTSNNEIVFTTDADCKAHPNWLKTMIQYFEDDVGIVTGFVLFDKETELTLFHKVQSLEFLSLVIAGAGSIGLNMPIIGNGANLAYRRSVFDEVNGFDGIDNLQSGDDDLFIQKVVKLTKWKIKCAKELASIITTNPVATIKQFLQQRTRWASKGVHYQNPYLVFYLISVYIYYLILFISLPFSIVNFRSFPYPIISFVLKCIFDFILLHKGTSIVKRRDLLKYFLLAEFFHIPYILIVGFWGIWGKYKWKGR